MHDFTNIVGLEAFLNVHKLLVMIIRIPVHIHCLLQVRTSKTITLELLHVIIRIQHFVIKLMNVMLVLV